MPDRVVDASVLAAFASGEARTDEARGLIDKATLFAPQILPYELANVALKKSKTLPSLRVDIAMRLRDALSLNVRLVRILPFELFRLSVETDLTPYDAAYLQTAQRLRCPLITFDAKLARHARRVMQA
jgi:predicted nucleic acid-binding protein